MAPAGVYRYCFRHRRLSRGYCPHCQAERRLARRSRSTSRWQRLRRKALGRDAGRCRFQFDGCLGGATQVHIPPEYRGDHSQVPLEE